MSVIQGAERLQNAGVGSPADAHATEDVAAMPADLSGLTNAELAELCRQRGIEPPKRAKKAELVALLAE